MSRYQWRGVTTREASECVFVIWPAVLKAAT